MTETILEGYLNKQSPKWKLWQSRYVKLTNVGLHYYSDKNGSERGLIPFSIISKFEVNEKKKRFEITVKINQRVFKFEASSDAELKRWSSAIQKAIQDYQDNDGHYVDDPQAQISDPIWKNAKRALQDHIRRNQMRNAAIQNVHSLSINDKELLVTKQLFDALLGDLKIVLEDTSGLDHRFGRLHVLGNSHYTMTRRSLLVHVVEKDNSPLFSSVVDSIQAYRKISHPLLAQQLHIGECSDAVFAIYHPPVRAHRDSLDAHLSYLNSFPEDAIRYIAAQLISIMESIHAAGYLFTNLCTETVFMDLSGFVRVFDYLLCLDPKLAPAIAVDYTTPDSTLPTGQTQKSDFWRLGVVLYELLTGMPPFRAQPSGVDEATGEPVLTSRDVLAEIDRFASKNGASLPFPDGTSPELRELIMSLLVINPNARLASFERIKQMPFFKSIPNWSVNAIMALPRPKWIVDHIMSPLRLEPETPANLDIQPDPISVTRVSVTISSARLPKELTNRVYYQISCEGQTDRSQVATDAASFTVSSVFELLSKDVPDSADMIIELYSRKHENALIGTVQVPLKAIRNGLMGSGNMALTIYTPEGTPVGELIASFVWREDDIPLNGGILDMFTPPEQPLGFYQLFGSKRSPDNPLKLLEMITNATWAKELGERFKTEPGQDEVTPEIEFTPGGTTTTTPVVVTGSPNASARSYTALPASPMTGPINTNTVRLQRSAQTATMRNVLVNSPGQLATMRVGPTSATTRALPSFVNPADEAAQAAAVAAAQAAATAATSSPRTGPYSPSTSAVGESPAAGSAAHGRAPSSFTLSGPEGTPAGSGTPTSGATATPPNATARGHRSSTIVPPTGLALPALPQTPIANQAQLRQPPPLPTPNPPAQPAQPLPQQPPQSGSLNLPPALPPRPSVASPTTEALAAANANTTAAAAVSARGSVVATATSTAQGAASAATSASTATTAAGTASGSTSSASRGTVAKKPRAQLTPEEIETANNNPEYWRTATDANTGKTYYYNKVTLVSLWKMPECMMKNAKQ